MMKLFKLRRRSRQSQRAQFAFACLAMLTLVTASAVSAQTVVEQANVPLTDREERTLVSALEKASDHGLAIVELPALREALADPAEGVRAGARERLLTVFQTHASALRGGRLIPSEANQDWGLAPEPFDAAGEFYAARTRGDLTGWIASLSPSQEGYALLVNASRHYQSIVASGGWAPVNGGALHEGDQGASVSALRDRLLTEGYDAHAAAEAETFDAPLAAALKTFQAAHALEPDGVLGEATRSELNVTAQQRLAQISVNQERWRWLPRSMPPTRIEVDVAGAQLNLIVNNEPSLTMRVIVGRARLPTPLFQAQIDEVVFNPAWNVPTSIASQEILPAAARDPTYLQRHGYVQLDGRVVQAPGPGNALGQIKFGSPNPYGVYLHDTPNRSLFARSDRRLSHGCMRVEAPRGLAAAILAAQGWTPTSIDAAIETGRTQRIPLTATLPVFVVYRTVRVGADGVVQFLPDGYAWDLQLQAALARRAMPSTRVPAPTPSIT
jgi:murein L,D-transpeptidase YcbB/YkuD